MQCKNHPEKNGTATCNQCGCWVCEDCCFERGGRIFCPSCAKQSVSADAPAATPPTFAGTGAAGTGIRHASWGLLFLFSVVIPLPGLNYMYLGMIKRGLAAMTAFTGAIYLLSVFGNVGSPASILFGMSIPILWLACTFDGFKLRRRINAGEVVTDNIDDITGFIRRNKVFIFGLLLLIAVSILMPGLIRLLGWIIPVAIVAFAVFVLFRKPKS